MKNNPLLSSTTNTSTTRSQRVVEVQCKQQTLRLRSVQATNTSAPLSASNKQHLYERDFYLWTQDIIQQLREKNLAESELEHLIEEIESMGKREQRELRSRLIVLLIHLLKWQYQPGKQSHSWRSTISEQRICLEELLEDSPSLKPFLPEVFTKCYQKARIKAAAETGIRQDIFPIESPFSIEETLDFDYLSQERE